MSNLRDRDSRVPRALPANVKGEMLVSNGESVVAISVGSDGQVLTADSSVSAGVSGQTPSGGGGGGGGGSGAVHSDIMRWIDIGL